jgi:hypothetical protein
MPENPGYCVGIVFLPLATKNVKNFGIQARSRSHERKISSRFFGIRVFRLEVSVYDVYITNQFQATFDRGRGGGV